MCDVLLLENEALIRTILAEELDENGFDVQEADNLFSAISILTEPGGVRLIVADQGLPDGDGHAFASAALARSKDMSVIYISGRGDVLMERVLGPTERTMTKPFLPSELVAMVQEMLPLSSAADPGRK